MAAVGQHEVGEACRIELGVLGMPVHDQALFLAAGFALDADHKVLAPRDAFERPHIDRFTPVAHPVAGTGEVVVLTVKVLGAERLGTVIELDRAVLVLAAEVRPVIPPDRRAVRCKVRLCVRIAVVEVVPEERGCRYGAVARAVVRNAEVLSDREIGGFAGFRSRHAGLDRIGARCVDRADRFGERDLIEPDYARRKRADVERVGHAREAGGFEVDHKILVFGRDDRMTAVSQHEIGKTRCIELGILGMPVHNQGGFFAALGALDADR